MKYGYTKICINAPFATCSEGHIQQTFLINEHKDDLYARAYSFINDDIWFINVSCDLIGVPAKTRDLIQEELRRYYNRKDLIVVIGATHTHYSHSIHDLKYEKFFRETLINGLKMMKYKDYESISSSYRKMHTTPVGKSRITGYETNLEFLSVVSFYSNDENFLNIVIHNCHPTTLEATSPFFSSEYPGILLSKLEKAYPGVDFIFLQGAAGDISSRFIRKGKTYENMLELAENIYKETDNLLKQEEIQKPIKLDYKETKLKVKHDFSDIDLSKIRDNLSSRELETIEYGKIIRLNIKKENKYIKESIISRINFGSTSLVYSGNEIFSDFMKNMNLDERMLIGYTNDDWPYVTPIDFNIITYELFYDTWSIESKKELLNLFETI